MILTTVGVFVDVAVITVSPIALAIARRAKLSRTAILLAMNGGGKAGNIMSPNPNALLLQMHLAYPLLRLWRQGSSRPYLDLLSRILLQKN